MLARSYNAGEQGINQKFWEDGILEELVEKL